MNPKDLFNGVDIDKIINDPDFKEDSVREVFVLPILKELGYHQKDITRSKTLKHPFLKVGTKKIPITQVPDYLIKVENSYAWVLDAKSPRESVTEPDNIEQVFSYAMHPEVRSTYFALCNGIEFALYRIGYSNEPVLHFSMVEIEHYWEKLKQFLSPESFQVGKLITYDTTSATAKPIGFDYGTRPLLEEIPVRKQAAKRHFGVHGYFTKQSWNVVATYIRNFSKPGDLVLDPFGGSGITAIEAMMNDRKAIHIDINPLTEFIINSLISPVDFEELGIAFDKVIKAFEKQKPKNKTDYYEILRKYKYPQNITLPKSSDVDKLEFLFTTKQLAHLALLKAIIKKEKNKSIRNTLLLAFSSSLNKYNKTFHYTRSEGGGDSGPFRYYRYRIAPNPGKLELERIFKIKFNKIFFAKKDVKIKINKHTIENIKVVKGTATDLSWIPSESVDYIYTDPPYGSKIPYLDLSTMWNSWLDLDVTDEDYKLEAIEGGEHNKTKSDYNHLISKSIEEMFRVLKFDRWMSFVFAHKDPEFWHLIINTAEKCGFEYVGAVPQKNGQSSFKKRQHPFTVLSGQLIINFRKVSNPKTIMKAHLGMDISDIVMQTIEGIIAKNNGATLEQINDELIIKGLELGFLDLLKKEYSDLTPILLSNFAYNSETDLFTIPHNTSFKTKVDVRLRIKYYLISYLRRMERENKNPAFEEIVFNILPLLKNGDTPENQTILNVLEDIGEHIGDGKWKLKKDGQQYLF
ncbi:MAG: DNA methylase [Bacteroidetes bacterium]|nr:MAG: DNA methylase [Bacteroidota bacterium]